MPASFKSCFARAGVPGNLTEACQCRPGSGTEMVKAKRSSCASQQIQHRSSAVGLRARGAWFLVWAVGDASRVVEPPNLSVPGLVPKSRARRTRLGSWAIRGRPQHRQRDPRTARVHPLDFRGSDHRGRSIGFLLRDILRNSRTVSRRPSRAREKQTITKERSFTKLSFQSE